MKHSSRSIFQSTRQLTTAASFAALLLAASTGRAANKTYIGQDNGLWSVAQNWSPFQSLPVAGDDVFLGNNSPQANTQDLHVTFDTSYVNPLHSLTLNSSAIGGYMILNQTGANTAMNATTQSIGTTASFNRYNQSAGTNTFNTMNLGATSSSLGNSYNISGTAKALIQDGGAMNIGFSGSGSVTQTGGVVDYANKGSNFTNITLGVNASGNGSYNLSGGTINADYLNVGGAGTGTFTQTGGTVNAVISVSDSGSDSAHGTYNFSGGTIKAGDAFNINTIYIGGYGVGTFNQTGGTISNYIELGDSGTSGGTGTYNLSGGTLSSAAIYLQAHSAFNLQTGGTFNSQFVQILNGGTFNHQGGSQTMAPDFDMLGGGTVNLQGHNFSVASLNDFTASSNVANDTVQNGANGNAGLTIGGSGVNDFSANFAGTIQDGGTGKLSLTYNNTKTGAAGTQILSGVSTYSGATLLLNGRLAAGSDTGFSKNSAFLMNGGFLDANGYNVTLGSLSGASGTVNVGTGSITANASTTNATFGGQMTGSGVFYKTGPDALFLTGGGNFTGVFNVQGGSLVSNANDGISNVSTVSLGDGTSLQINYAQSLARVFSSSYNATIGFSNSSLQVGGTGADSGYYGKFTGTGVLTKNGGGTFTLGSGDTTANTDTGLDFIVNAGQLVLSRAAGTNAVAGALTINGGSVVLGASNQIADSSVLTTAGSGVFNLNGKSENIGGLAGSGGSVAFNGGSLTVTAATARTYGGALVGPGSFTKAGTADLTLTNTSSYGGTLTARNGRLILQGAVDTTGMTAGNGGTLRLDGASVNLNAGSLQANTGGTVEYVGATVGNGYLRGTGTHVIQAGGASTFNGVTTYNSTVITQNGVASFNNFTNGGVLNNNTTLTYNGGVNASSGVVNVNSTINTQDFTSNGVINLNAGGTINNTVSSLVAGGGSRTYIASGGVLNTAGGTAVELNGALLVNNGTMNGALNVNYGSTAKGTGTFGSVTVNDGGHFGVNAKSPNTNNATLASVLSLASLSPALVGPELNAAPGTVTVGSLTLGSNSVFAFELQNATGAAGVGYDLTHSTGALTLAAGTQAGTQIIISLTTLAADGSNGLAANFDPAKSYQFTLVQADGGIMGYNAGEFAVDTSGFANALQGGTFAVLQSGNNLVLAYQAVPEPGTWAAIAFSGVLLAVATNRRRRC